MFLSIFKQRLKDIYLQTWHEYISSSSNLNHYSSIKSSFQIENYIQSLKDKSLVRVLCKFRISLHTFKINLYRQRKCIDLKDVICTNCNSGDIEDEFHILFNCNKYAHLRLKYLPELKNMVSCKQSMINILNSQNVCTIHSLAVFLKHVFMHHNTCIKY